MKDVDFDGFSQVWVAAWELYGKPISPSAVTFAFNALSGYELSAIRDALGRHALDPDTGQYPPKPADVVRCLQGGKGDRAARAFTTVMQSASSVGAYESVVFDDPVVHAVIADMGGWPDFCHTDLGESNAKLPFLEREFCRRYQGYLVNPPSNYPGKLVGIIEQANEHTGRLEHIPEPVLIGDPLRATHVLRSGSDKPRLQITRRMQSVVALASPAKEPASVGGDEN